MKLAPGEVPDDRSVLKRFLGLFLFPSSLGTLVRRWEEQRVADERAERAKGGRS